MIPEAPNEDVCPENFNNKVVYANSFTVSQKDILESVLRVTGTKEDEWSTKMPGLEGYSTGTKEIQKGERVGFCQNDVYSSFLS